MDQLLKQFESTLKSLLEGLIIELSQIRTNRPTGKLVEDIKVDYMEAVLPVKQLGTIGINPPREIVISPWDKGAAPAIAKAIEEASPGVTASIDGPLVRVSLPQLTAERREELLKFAKATAEKMRIRFRTERDGANKAVERMFQEKSITEDQKFKAKKKVQEAIDKMNGDIERMVDAKVKEISE